MAKDDYHVIVYQILFYLYQCLKKGEPVDKKKLDYGSELLRINESYWSYILYNMHCMGLMEKAKKFLKDIKEITPFV